MRVALIGSGGVLGVHLAEALELRGYEVIRVSHSHSPGALTMDALCDDPTTVIAACDVVIYCAWATKNRDASSQQLHADSAGRWASICNNQNTKFLFLSTVLAAPSCLSNYGRYKYVAEKFVLEHKGVVLRVGLVADDAMPLLLTQLRNITRRYKFVAHLADWPIYPISSTDFIEIICQQLSSPRNEHVIWVANRSPVPLSHAMVDFDQPKRLSEIVKYALRLVGKIPLRNGKLGWLLDGWAGITSCSMGWKDCDDPVSPEPEDMNWRFCLSPYTYASDSNANHVHLPDSQMTKSTALTFDASLHPRHK